MALLLSCIALIVFIFYAPEKEERPQKSDAFWFGLVECREAHKRSWYGHIKRAIIIRTWTNVIRLVLALFGSLFSRLISAFSGPTFKITQSSFHFGYVFPFWLWEPICVCVRSPFSCQINPAVGRQNWKWKETTKGEGEAEREIKVKFNLTLSRTPGDVIESFLIFFSSSSSSKPQSHACTMSNALPDDSGMPTSICWMIKLHLREQLRATK